MAYSNIKQPNLYFNTKLYTGNGGTQSITGVGFQPDFTWIKYRNSGTYGHDLYDAVRGATKTLNTNNGNAEYTSADRLTAFASDGFNLDSNASVNENSGTYVSWNWNANGAGVANTDGSISSTVSASTTSGFSIVSYTGTGSAGTVGTGLGAVPKMIIIKDRSAADNWNVYNSSSGNNSHMHLNLNFAASGSSSYWNTTTPTSSVFSLGSIGDVNANGNNFIAYCFADVQGFSKFGSYTGNGSTDGTFVYTGFKPAFVMIKATDAIKSWMILDNKRNPTGKSGANTVDYRLKADTSEATNDNTGGMDFLSNGFKLYSTDTSTNQSGTNYIYMAFAEQPLVGDNPATAR